MIAGAARLSARSGWAKVKALGEAPRGRPAQRDQSRGEAERLRVVEAAGTTLTAHKMGRYRTGQS
ncbi:MAG: hypothetical protein WC378_08735 [Opitutaceae bacterium]